MLYFIGAGPGAADLITVRGAKLLSQADVVIYAGSLVNPDLLSLCKAGCEIHNSASMTLEEVTSVMLAAEKADKLIVRLHTGDPCIYGAIKEQMAVLDANGIEYTVVPGVSSFLGAAAAIKAELTLPSVSQTIILTRMEGRTPVPERESIRSLAKHRASMAIFLSASMLPELSSELIDGGYTANTAATIVYKATWDDERIVKTNIGELADAAKAAGIDKTALIFVGDFLDSDYERSKLYDPEFTHMFRNAK
jgi:precorrin-4/cobalt-precorrin-4 C11-methyltransferase